MENKITSVKLDYCAKLKKKRKEKRKKKEANITKKDEKMGFWC